VTLREERSLCRSRRPLWKHDHIGWNRDPGSLRLDPDVTLYLWPLGVIERCHCNSSKTRPYLRGMGDRCPALGAKLHPEPPAALVGAVLILRKHSLQNLHVALIEVGDRCERGAESPLAEPAMADLANLRVSLHPIPNGAANATTFVKLVHHFGVSLRAGTAVR
jgi:hypothetical protein